MRQERTKTWNHHNQTQACRRNLLRTVTLLLVWVAALSPACSASSLVKITVPAPKLGVCDRAVIGARDAEHRAALLWLWLLADAERTEHKGKHSPSCTCDSHSTSKSPSAASFLLTGPVLKQCLRVCSWSGFSVYSWNCQRNRKSWGSRKAAARFGKKNLSQQFVCNRSRQFAILPGVEVQPKHL